MRGYVATDVPPPTSDRQAGLLREIVARGLVLQRIPGSTALVLSGPNVFIKTVALRDLFESDLEPPSRGELVARRRLIQRTPDAK